MKKNFTLKLKWVGLFLLLLCALQSQAQTTYTVNSALPTGGNNFTNFTDLATELNTNGISGPVVVNVVPGSGPYVDTLHFKHISGSSATNTIRVNGNGETITYNFYYNGMYYYYGHGIVTFDSTKYVTVDNLIIKNSDTDYYGGYLQSNVLFMRGSSYDSLTNCVIDLTNDSAYYNGGYNRTGIIFAGTAGYYYYYGLGSGSSNCYVGYNQIIDSTSWNNNIYYNYGGYIGIGIMKGSDHNIIDHNIINARQLYNIYQYGAKNTSITYNDIRNTPNTSNLNYTYQFVGIYTEDTINGTEIIGNRIHDPGVANNPYYTGYACRGMQLNGHGTAAEPILVANNAIYNLNFDGSIYGIQVAGRYSKIYNNTISIHDTSSNALADYGIYVSSIANGNEGIEIINNNVSITGGGIGDKYGFYYQDFVTDAQKNNFYVHSVQPGTDYYGFYFSDYSTQSAFQAANPNLELSSPVADPQFVNEANGNLSVQNLALIAQGEDLSSVVPLDILQNPRPQIPTLGAFEAVLATNNAAVNTFITPKDSFCASTQPVSVLIYNAGVNDIDSLQLHWTVNGAPQPVLNYTHTLTSIASTAGQHTDTVLLGNIFIPSGSPTIIKVWTALPNGMADTVNTNDTIIKSFQAIPSDYFVVADLDTICSSLNAHLSLMPDTGNALSQLTWQYSNNGTNWLDLPNSDSTSYTDDNMTNSKWYRVKLNMLHTCYSDTLHITVINPQILTTVASGGCDSSEITLAAQSNANTILNWYDAPSSTTVLDTGNSFTTPPLMTSTTYYVAAMLNGVPGCESPRQPVVATIEHRLPDIPLHDTSFCNGYTAFITAGHSGNSYLWNTGDSTKSIQVSDSGIYSVAITSNYNCVSKDSIQVVLSPLANVNGFNFIPLFAPHLGTVKFFPIDPVAVDHYQWQFGDGTVDTSPNPIHTYAATGDYIVSLTVSNDCGSITLTQIIHVELTTGIVTLKSNQTADVILYPNPGRSIITVQSKNPELRMDQISIYNMMGAKVYETSVNNVVKEQISVSNLAAGTYLLRVLTNNNMTITRKFQIIH